MAEAFFTVDLREEGVLLARGRFTYPTENELCVQIVDRARAWLREGLFEEARRLYLEDPSPKKRFCFGRLCYTLTILKTEGALRITATLVQEGRTLAAYDESLPTSAGAFCPPTKNKRKTTAAASHRPTGLCEQSARQSKA